MYRIMIKRIRDCYNCKSSCLLIGHNHVSWREYTPVSETEQSVHMLDLLILSSRVDLDISQSFRCEFTFRKSKLT